MHASPGHNLRLSLIFSLFVLVAALLCTAARAQEQPALRGVALVIGQSEYEHLSPLANPANDADAIEALLADLGFDSVRRSDRDADRLARDLERFVEDAADADVAILYYAGHGIEAGGENYLVPVDADLTSLDAAGERLVPVSGFIRQLQETVPVTIVMLDACRDNPFPAGALVRHVPDAEPQPMAGGGLAETRGASRLAPDRPPEETYGTVVSFAAAPGRAALDGAPGGHSPYTAAVLRHFSEMAGIEFGTVMRMVAEEVYLATEGRQRPWINESLRRLLYFGEAPDPVDGPEGEILEERRRLLVTISDLPRAQRVKAENMAASGDVPMSVVFAMMQALGIDPSEDPETVENRLRREIENFAKMRAARQTFENPDDEIVRLTALADRAEDEGALAAANRFRDEAKQRVRELRGTREEQIETLRQRILEDAAVFERSAETKKLLFHHADAAQDYATASEIVARWDDGLAASYRYRGIIALLADAELRGIAASLDAAEDAARVSLQAAVSNAQAATTKAPEAGSVRLRHALGVVLMLRSERTGNPAALQEAVAMHREAVAHAEILEPDEHVRLLIDAGRAMAQAGLAGGNAGLLAEAETLFARAASLAEKNTLQALRIEARFRTLQALHARWAAAPDAGLWQRMTAEVAQITLALDAGEPDAFSARYIARVLNMALDLAARTNSVDALTTVTEISGIAASIFDVDRFPLIVADLNDARSRIALEWAERFGEYSLMRQGLELQRSAVGIYADAGAVPQLRRAQWQLAMILAAIGTIEFENATLVEAIALTEQLQADLVTRDHADWANAIRFQLARLRGDLAYRKSDEWRLRRETAAMQALFDSARGPVYTTPVAAELGRMHYRLAMLTGAEDGFRQSVDWMDKAIGQHDAWNSAVTNPVPYSNLYAIYADATAALAFNSGDKRDLAWAIDANERLGGLFSDQNNIRGVVSIANVIGNLSLQELAHGFGPANHARAQLLLDEASLLAEGEQFVAVQRTRCLLELAAGKDGPTPEIAARAVERCSTSLDAIHTFGPENMVPEAAASMRQAEALSERAGRGP